MPSLSPEGKRLLDDAIDESRENSVANNKAITKLAEYCEENITTSLFGVIFRAHEGSVPVASRHHKSAFYSLCRARGIVNVDEGVQGMVCFPGTLSRSLGAALGGAGSNGCNIVSRLFHTEFIAGRNARTNTYKKYY